MLLHYTKPARGHGTLFALARFSHLGVFVCVCLGGCIAMWDECLLERLRWCAGCPPPQRNGNPPATPLALEARCRGCPLEPRQGRELVATPLSEDNVAPRIGTKRQQVRSGDNLRHTSTQTSAASVPRPSQRSPPRSSASARTVGRERCRSRSCEAISPSPRGQCRSAATLTSWTAQKHSHFDLRIVTLGRSGPVWARPAGCRLP